jgi:hypothetical protein
LCFLNKDGDTLHDTFGNIFFEKDITGVKLLNFNEQTLKQISEQSNKIFPFFHKLKLFKEISKIKENNNCFFNFFLKILILIFIK